MCTIMYPLTDDEAFCPVLLAITRNLVYAVPPNLSQMREEGYMAYITRKRIKGTTYYYAEECERKNGRVKRKWQKYLGSVEKIVQALTMPGPTPLFADIFLLGTPAAYLRIVEDYKIIPILDSVLPKRNQGLSFGFYLALAAINRGFAPVSKRSMWHWFQSTILLRRFPHVTRESLSSQRFWDNMVHLDFDRLRTAWLKLVSSILDREKIDLSRASFDGTNFYTFIGSFNVRSSLAQRGKNKQGRNNLRQVNYALFCTRRDQFPLYFDVYEGNRNDSKEFGLIIDKFFSAFGARQVDGGGMTIVFDKGINSRKNFEHFIDGYPFHFVASAKIDEHKDLAAIRNDDRRLVALADPRLDGVRAWRTQRKMYGREVTAIVTFNQRFHDAQVQSINNEVNKALEKLAALGEKLKDRQDGRLTLGKCPTADSVRSQITKILRRQHLKHLIQTTVDVDPYSKVPVLTYHFNGKHYAELIDTHLGKSIIFTDNANWTDDEIVRAYFDQYVIEDAFKQMKDRTTGSWWPMNHWTDAMVGVHGFYCSLALLLRSLIVRRVSTAGVQISIKMLHEKLGEIREVLNVFPTERGKKSKQRTQSVVSRMDETQEKVFKLFDMEDYLTS